MVPLVTLIVETDPTPPVNVPDCVPVVIESRVTRLEAAPLRVKVAVADPVPLEFCPAIVTAPSVALMVFVLVRLKVDIGVVPVLAAVLLLMARATLPAAPFF